MLLVSFKRILLITLLCFTVSACNSVEYLDRGSLKQDIYSYHSNGDYRSPKNYGAILFRTSKSSDASENRNHRMFVLKKQNKKYIAETLLFDNAKNKKSYFKKSYISFGTDRRNKSFGVNFRFIY